MFKTKPTISAWTKSVLTPLMFLMAVVAYAQPTTVVTTSFTGTKNWSDGTAWSGGSAPSSGDNVQIGPNAKINLDSDVSISTLTLSGTGVLNCGSYTVTITDQFYANTCTGLNAQTGTFIFNSTVASGGSQRTIDGTCTSGVTFYNVEIPSSAVVDFGPSYDGVTPTVESTITNELLLDGGGVVKNPPIYGGSSTLRYNNAYVIGTEWTMDATSGGGVPHHVSVEGSSSLDFADSTGVYTCLGNFDIVGPTSSIDLSDFLGDLKVTLDFSAGTANTATITMPTTEGKGNLVVLGDLTLGASATVSGDEGNLILAGDFTHNATSSAFGMVKFNGAGADQDLTGNVITVDSLVVANTNNTATNDQDVDLNANVDITPGGVFNPVDGTTNISGTFTMNSNASGTARIATLENSGATSNVVGNITFERYVPSTATTTWLVMGNYVTTSPAMDVQDWMDDFGGSIYVYSHDETVNANANGTNGWTYMNSTSTLSTDGIGYFSIVPSSLGTSGHTLSNSGTYTTATVSPGVSHTAGPYNQFYDPAGWNLLVNPYPTPIDGDAFVSNNGSVSEYYILQNSSGNWLSSSQVGSLEAPDAIDIGQGFYAYVASGNGGTASFTPNLACYGGNTFTRSEDTSLQGAFALNIEDESERYGGTTIKFHLEGEADFQPGLDAPYKAGASANPRIFSQLEDGTKLAVNVPFMLENSNEMIALTIQTGVDGQVSISIDESTELPAGLCARLIDTVTEEAIDVASETMSLELEPMETYENRFYLEFLSTPVFEQTVSHCEGGTIHFNGGNAQNWNITWDSGEMSGEGCATNLDPGTYELNAVNTLNGCTTSDMLEIPDVCLGDFNFNGGRDIPDLLMLLIELQPVSNLEQPILQTDCDCDGIITTSDLLMFLPYFGSTCE